MLSASSPTRSLDTQRRRPASMRQRRQTARTPCSIEARHARNGERTRRLDHEYTQCFGRPVWSRPWFAPCRRGVGIFGGATPPRVEESAHLYAVGQRWRRDAAGIRLRQRQAQIKERAMRMIRLDRRLATAALVALVVVLASTMLQCSPALAAEAGVGATHVHTALPVSDATHSVIVKLIGDGEMQVTSPDDDTEIHVSRASVTFSNLPTIATAPCVAQATFPFAVDCPVDQVKSVLVLTSVGDDVVRTLVGEVPVTVITGDGNDIVIDN